MMKLAIFQMHIEENPELNINKVCDYTKDLENHVILLPELFTTGFDYKLIEEITEKHIELLYKLPDNNIYLGSVARQIDNKRYNSFFVKNNESLSFPYDKMHLFPLLNEGSYFSSGIDPGVFSIYGTDCGASICFDLRYPELMRVYFRKNVSIIFLPAEWPLARKEHLEVLSRARAIENQCFMVVCNTVGKVGDEIFAGCSSVIDPWGEYQIKLQDETDKIATTELNLNLIEEVRNKLPLGQ